MKRTFYTLVAFACAMTVLLAVPARASQHIWDVTSPDHGQTYSYGSQTSCVWKALGPDKHLAMYGTFDNEPFAEGSYRRYDNFTFNFPKIKLGPGGNTFFYHTSNGLALVVARQKHGLFGVPEVVLLPTAYCTVKKVHGYLTVTLVIGDAPFETDPGTEIGIFH